MPLIYKLNNKYEILDYETNKYIFNNETGFVFEINDVGYKIIELIKLGKNLKEIIMFISIEYDKEKNELENDVKSFISQLLDKEILTSIEGI
jgi:hypothetical protein